MITGIKDAEYLAQFLGKKIAIRVGPQEPIKVTFCYWVYRLESIHANGSVVVKDTSGRMFAYKWTDCENPYVILADDKEIVIK